MGQGHAYWVPLSAWVLSHLSDYDSATLGQQCEQQVTDRQHAMLVPCWHLAGIAMREGASRQEGQLQEEGSRALLWGPILPVVPCASFACCSLWELILKYVVLS